MEIENSLIRRNSKQRELIFEIVHMLKSHPRADEVYHIAKRTMPSLSLGTVYRNLKLLVKEGKIKEVQFESGISRFDGITDDHEHFICTNCGTVTDIEPTPALKHYAFAHPGLRHLTVSGYHLVYHGLCNDCRLHK
jgi:Fe2+ or Zn2+ uptake regulation protein